MKLGNLFFDYNWLKLSVLVYVCYKEKFDLMKRSKFYLSVFKMQLGISRFNKVTVVFSPHGLTSQRKLTRLTVPGMRTGWVIAPIIKLLVTPSS